MRSLTETPPSIDRPHDARVLAALRRRGPLTRAELGVEVGLSRTTLSQVVGDLLDRGVLHAYREAAPEGPGRPVERVHLAPAAGYALGIDLGRRRAHIM